MRRLLALAAIAAAAGCGGDELTRAEAEQRAAEAVAAALSSGTIGPQVAKMTTSADESMNRDEGVPLGSGVEESAEVTLSKTPDVEERDDAWMATYAVVGVDDVFVCVSVTEEESDVAVRTRC